jgi:acetyl esterase/lipase
MRVSWEKSKNPYLSFLVRQTCPRLSIYKKIFIPRPSQEPCGPSPVQAYIFYCGPVENFADAKGVILDFPGGGFVTMSPPCHTDYLSHWAAQNPGVPIVSIDYGKAPEFPYPWGMEECYDAYRSIVGTNGACIGLSGENDLRIAIVGDSAYVPNIIYLY